MELANLLAGLAKSDRAGKRLRHALAFYFAQYAKLRMPGGACLGAMARRLTTAAWSSGYRSGAEVTEGKELLQESSATGLKLG